MKVKFYLFADDAFNDDSIDQDRIRLGVQLYRACMYLQYANLRMLVVQEGSARDQDRDLINE
jgi:hypothetical protein